MYSYLPSSVEEKLLRKWNECCIYNGTRYMIDIEYIFKNKLIIQSQGRLPKERNMWAVSKRMSRISPEEEVEKNIPGRGNRTLKGLKTWTNTAFGDN